MKNRVKSNLRKKGDLMKLAFGVSYEEYWRIIPFAYERCCGKGWSNLLANIYGITFVGVYEIMAAVVARRGTHPKNLRFFRDFRF